MSHYVYAGSRLVLADGIPVQAGPHVTRERVKVTVRFDVIDRRDELVGELMVDRASPPTLKWDRTADVPRILDGLAVPARPNHVNAAPGVLWAGDVDPDVHEIRPVWIDGTDETNLGVLVFRSWEWREDLAGRRDLIDGVCYDQTYWLRDKLRNTFAVGPGNSTSSLKEAVHELARDADIPAGRISLPNTDVTLPRPLAWPSGTRRSAVLDALVKKGAWVWYFDRDGVLTLRRQPTPALDPPDVVYAAGQTSTILMDSAHEGRDRGARHNEWVVISVDPSDTAVTATYRLPPDAAGSAQQTGRTRTQIIEEAGLSQDEARERAREAARQEWRRETVFEFDTLPNPDHDGHTIVEVDGTVWLEDSWSLTLSPGGPMTHRASRTEGL